MSELYEYLLQDLTKEAEAVVDPTRYTGPFTAAESKHLLEQLATMERGLQWEAGADRYVSLAGKVFRL